MSPTIHTLKAPMKGRHTRTLVHHIPQYLIFDPKRPSLYLTRGHVPTYVLMKEVETFRRTWKPKFMALSQFNE